MTLIEFLNIDTSTEKGVDDLFGYVETYLQKMCENHEAINLIVSADMVFEKMTHCIKEYGLSKEYDNLLFDDSIKTFIEFVLGIVQGHKAGRTHFMRMYNPVYEKTIKFYYDIKKIIHDNKGDNVFNDVLDKNQVLKSDIKFLLTHSIELIESNTTLPIKAKAQVVDKIRDAISEVDSPTTNWSRFLGKLKEATIIASAIITIAGVSMKDILSAKENIEKATLKVEQTTISNITIQNQLNIGNKLLVTNTNINTDSKEE